METRGPAHTHTHVFVFGTGGGADERTYLPAKKTYEVYGMDFYVLMYVAVPVEPPISSH